MYKLALFDMDGTFIDTDLTVVISFVDLFNKYDPSARPTIKELLALTAPPIRESLKKYFPNADLEETFKDWSDFSSKYYEKYLVPFPGAIECAKKLKEAGVRIAVITGKHRDPLNHCLSIIGCEDLFDFAVCGGDTAPKPSPEPMFKALEIAKVDAKDAIYIGDHNVDVNASLAANIDCALAQWAPRKVILDKEPTYRVNSYDEFLEIVLNGK